MCVVVVLLSLLLLVLVLFANIRVTVINLNIVLVSKNDPVGSHVLVDIVCLYFNVYVCVCVCVKLSTSLMSFGCNEIHSCSTLHRILHT